MRPLLLVTLLLAAVFLLWPELDLHASAPFFAPNPADAEHRFFLAWNPWVRWAYDAVQWLTRGTVLALFLALIARRVQRKPLLPVLYLMAALALGPGLIVHFALKEHVGRPRPHQTVQFDGTEAFVPALHIGEGEGKSFVSGHAAMGFYFTALALLARGRGRGRVGIYAGSVALGLAIGAVRMVQGGHFLSDVLFAGVLILWINHGLYYALFERHNSRIPSPTP